GAVVGTRRLEKAIEADRVAVAYVADDADLMIKNRLNALCARHGVRVVGVASMTELGKACGIDVPSASAGLLK
ncbi:MAG: ribosomal L7Ae/L30e/S12e/Gadd45 family protein, partial [Eubacteriales bacterium]|nr:ribosomal L7Ae/L30e/S12e/Gadd45 family protein [Eubacteriales bacterium]